MESRDCPKCGNEGEEKSSQRRPHIKDLCPIDGEKIDKLVEKLAECTKAKQKLETELVEMRSEHATMLNRWEIRCNEQEAENNRLKAQLEGAASRAKMLKKQSAKSLDALGKQLQAQEREFVKLTDTVRELLREKINLQNSMIERDSRVQIAEAKLERARETLEMEKLLFIKEHVRDSIVRNYNNRGCQTTNFETTIMDNKASMDDATKKIDTKIKCKDDLDDSTSDGILLRSLFFKSNIYDDDDDNSPINIIYGSTK